MPTQPPIEGLPVWAQILISILVGISTLGVAFKGYFQKDKAASSVEAGDKTTAAVLAASITDMGAIRHLSDVCILLTGAVQALTKAVDEQTHHERNSIETNRELCARTRALCEIMERHLK